MSTPDTIWKASVTAGEVSDRIKGQSMAALPAREISADSIEGYWRGWETLQITPHGDLRSFLPAVLLDEVGWLRQGEGYLRLPDGTRWVMASARITREDVPHDNAFLRRLRALLLEHQALRRPHGPPSCWRRTPSTSVTSSARIASPGAISKPTPRRPTRRSAPGRAAAHGGGPAGGSTSERLAHEGLHDDVAAGWAARASRASGGTDWRNGVLEKVASIRARMRLVL